MITYKTSICAALTFIIVAGPATSFAACTAQSAATTAALVELYTSEGCSSCPPADEQLRHIRQAIDANAAVVPIALHVDYWDSIGWKDPYAQASFSERQRWLVQLHRNTTVYTPHFFVSGAELGEWRSGLRGEVQRLNAQPAAADIALRASLDPGGDRLDIAADASVRPTSKHPALYLAVAENGLVSKVTRGENSGATLAHDHVVRQWVGPIQFSDGKAHVQRAIGLPAAWDRAQLEVVAFVEDDATGNVLQALSTQQCARF